MLSFEEIAKKMTASGHPMCKENARKIHNKALEKLRIILNLPENHEIRDDFVEIVNSSGETATSYKLIMREGKIYERH